jgi:hypothetical protein
MVKERKRSQTKIVTSPMIKKYKIACPNCRAFKLWSWSPAGMCLSAVLGSIITACIPIIGWLLFIPLALADFVLIPATIVFYLIPKMRIVTVRCRQCEWTGLPASLSSLKPHTAS